MIPMLYNISGVGFPNSFRSLLAPVRSLMLPPSACASVASTVKQARRRRMVH